MDTARSTHRRRGGDPGKVTQPAPPVARMVEVKGVGRNTGKATRGPRSSATPLNATALEALEALAEVCEVLAACGQAPWARAAEVRALLPHLTPAAVASGLREARAVGKADSRRAGPQIGAQTLWRALP
jgi:hypothetical protein